ncbi:hypothetical protein P4O66_004929 [Electrophorus voltai]|uniref:Uncharacterized protein n=1 Tax=Electrophorus voltai TaxID=2609070 RepID=A0AAD8ZY44_9TELE|nr:hypothetical protein P4O66_004929 [Electrophorus voltai]
MVQRGLNIIMIVLAVLQFCVTVSSCVLSTKTLSKKKGDEMLCFSGITHEVAGRQSHHIIYCHGIQSTDFSIDKERCACQCQ